VLSAGGTRDRIYMNCSGKHTAMLLTCLAAGWATEGYTDPDHPLQVRLRESVESFAREPVTAVGTDGCGAPVMAISLTGLARAFHSFVEAPTGSAERSVADAMRAYPEIVSGTNQDDDRLMRGVPGLLGMRLGIRLGIRLGRGRRLPAGRRRRGRIAVRRLVAAGARGRVGLGSRHPGILSGPPPGHRVSRRPRQLDPNGFGLRRRLCQDSPVAPAGCRGAAVLDH